jgi:hypothetical protein
MGLLSDFLGKSQRKDLAAAKAESDAALQQGYGQGQTDYTAAENYFAPYANQGQAANTFYNNALGLGTEAERTAALGTLTSNPLFQGQLGQDSNALLRNLNARGQSGGGMAALAGQRVFQQNAGNWLDRYRDQGQQGLQATNQMAGYRAGRGDMSYGYGATKAGNAVNFGNAMAANRNTGINNLMGVASLGVSGINAFNKPKLG